MRGLILQELKSTAERQCRAGQASYSWKGGSATSVCDQLGQVRGRRSRPMDRGCNNLTKLLVEALATTWLYIVWSFCLG